MVPPSPLPGQSEASSPPPTPLTSPDPSKEISDGLAILADLHQGDDQSEGEINRNTPSEDESEESKEYEMDSLVPQYEGGELVEAMGLDMEREDKFLRALGAEREKAYGSVKKDVSATEWKVAETQSLGYNPGSANPPPRMKQRHAKQARELAEYNQEMQKSSVFQAL